METNTVKDNNGRNGGASEVKVKKVKTQTAALVEVVATASIFYVETIISKHSYKKKKKTL